ncbi:MAG: glycine--tRNA ligase subunit beta, partial [Desulfatitalea sp.]|nr:glycine--tRNA ligase subunit beta [Desulfatitalea sp.]NNK02722.1 glycine--tRNA ligase subunit beta [Desulfatitalea sp.]
MESFLLEIGTEEIPAGYIRPALDALADQLRRKLDHARIDHGPAHTLGTPRRLAVWVEQVAQRQKPVTEQVLGPPERIAFDAQGNLSIPGRKFAEKVGLPPEQLRLVETEKGKYLCADLTDKGTVTRTVLKEILPDLILNLPFPKTMRWSDLNIAFARPIQSVAALHGKKVIFFTLDPKLKSGRSTRGHQFMHRKRVQIESAASYRAQMREAQVIVDVAE